MSLRTSASFSPRQSDSARMRAVISSDADAAPSLAVWPPFMAGPGRKREAPGSMLRPGCGDEGSAGDAEPRDDLREPMRLLLEGMGAGGRRRHQRGILLRDAFELHDRAVDLTDTGALLGGRSRDGGYHFIGAVHAGDDLVDD